MGVLPNLDPSEAGHVAFYNAIEQGGLSPDMMTWSDVLDNGSVNEYEPFDNGLRVKYNDDAWGNIIIRMKTDGWVVAYTGWDGSSPGEGTGPAPHQISKVSGGSDSNIDGGGDYTTLTNNRLALAIEDMLTDLSDWPAQVAGSFSKSDVGLYDFATGADGISLFAESRDLDNASGSWSRSIGESGGTNLHVATGFLRLSQTGGGSGSEFSWSVDGTKVVDIKPVDLNDYGATHEISNIFANSGSVNMSSSHYADGWSSIDWVAGAISYWSEA